jgi:Protein of unknown function (DUF3347)
MKYLSCTAMILMFAACNTGSEKKAAENSGRTASTPVTIQTSEATKKAITGVLGAYYQLKDALVEADTLAANKAAVTLATLADSIRVDGIKDSSLSITIKNFSGTIAAEAIALPEEQDITGKRRSFSMITENLYPLLQSVQYNESVIYHEMCPMAFNDTEAAFWLSDNREIVNPYLGKKHPKYASGMLHCGELKDSLSYSK